MSEKGRKPRYVGFELGQDIYDELKEIADSEGVPVSQVIRVSIMLGKGRAKKTIAKQKDFR